MIILPGLSVFPIGYLVGVLPITLDIVFDTLAPILEHFPTEYIEDDKQYAAEKSIEIDHKKERVVGAVQDYGYPKDPIAFAPTDVAEIDHRVEIAHSDSKEEMPGNSEYGTAHGYALPFGDIAK